MPEKIRPTVILKYCPKAFFIKPSSVMRGTMTPSAITTPGRAYPSLDMVTDSLIMRLFDVM